MEFPPYDAICIISDLGNLEKWEKTLTMIGLDLIKGFSNGKEK
jgi:hypothetical protein